MASAGKKGQAWQSAYRNVEVVTPIWRSISPVCRICPALRQRGRLIGRAMLGFDTPLQEGAIKRCQRAPRVAQLFAGTVSLRRNEFGGNKYGDQQLWRHCAEVLGARVGGWSASRGLRRRHTDCVRPVPHVHGLRSPGATSSWGRSWARSWAWSWAWSWARSWTRSWAWSRPSSSQRPPPLGSLPQPLEQPSPRLLEVVGGLSFRGLPSRPRSRPADFFRRRRQIESAT